MCSSQAKHQPSLSNSLIFTISKFQLMKKTYITPETYAISLAMTLPLALSGHDEYGDLLVKEKVEDGATTTIGSKSIWDEEW